MRQQRNTKQRQLVLDAVQAHFDHPSADQIYLEVRAINNKISRGTVYRNLHMLVAQGEILRVRLPNMEPDRFEHRLDTHYHLLCTECGTVCDAPLLYNKELDKEVFEKTGYVIKRHRTVFEGLCPACKQKKH